MSKGQQSSDVQSDGEVIEEVLEPIVEVDAEAGNEEAEVVEEVEVDTEVSVLELQKQLAQAEKKATENWDKVLRIQAEMDNLKRRTQKDLDSAH